MHVRLTGETVEIRPIAGTRPRGATSGQDERNAAELLADPKERAEHIMLVTWRRNDVGRVADFGTVRVTEMMTIERYSHVMHIVSNVTGRCAAVAALSICSRQHFPPARFLALLNPGDANHQRTGKKPGAVATRGPSATSDLMATWIHASRCAAPY